MIFENYILFLTAVNATAVALTAVILRILEISHKLRPVGLL